MLDAVLELVPSARVGHIGLQRDEATAIASKYYTKLPRNMADSFVLMIDTTPPTITNNQAGDNVWRSSATATGPAGPR